MRPVDSFSLTAAISGSDDPGRFEMPADFDRAITGLALAVNHTLISEQKRVYAFSLRDLDLGVVRRACVELAKTAVFFPKVAELRTCAEALARADAAPAKYLPPRPDERTYACGKCFDDPAGWRQIACLGGSTAACGRSRERGAHPFAVRCVCWLRRNADAIRFSYQQSLQKNQPPPREYAALTALESGAYAWN